MSGGIKLFVNHAPDCRLGDARPEFIVPPREGGLNFWRKKNGQRGGSTLWHVFVCNDISCPARVGVRWDTLMEFIAEGLKEARP